MKNYLCILLLTLSFNSANAAGTSESTSFKCQDTKLCNEAAQICGKLAGISYGRKTCVAETIAPHPDYVWQREVTVEHCMGHLPIAATLNDSLLYETFMTNYQAEFERSFQASGCAKP